MHIPGYTLDTEIYRGRKRVVWRARRHRDGEVLIIKALTDDFPSPAETAGLRREFEILRGFSVPGIARALGLEHHRDRPMLVLGDAGDITLKALVASAPVDLGRALSLAESLASVLAEVHRAGIVHRDVNPSNVVVDSATGRLTLIDFGIASRTRSEPQRAGSAGLVEGTLAYMSPEQTGRMNRELDYRSDLYSLGVTCYELLTGRLPFESLDPLEVMHGHVARMPVPPHQLDSRIPPVVSDLVMRLLAKSAEDRYQSADGVAADLRRSRDEWAASGTVRAFHLGQHDRRDQFAIPHRLYGREAEVERLLAAFERVAGGPSGMVLVAGYSGIGKTSVIQETHRVLAERGGYFIAGKFDQLARDVPYAALAQALRGLIRQLLTEPDEKVAAWRRRLLDALGSSGQVLVDVIPDLALLIGPQPAVVPLGATEAQNRFNLVFQQFLGVLARPEQPLVLFLDDLQWADSATLALLPVFMANPDIGGLLVVGAYRDNEVTEAHQLRAMIRDLRGAGVPLTELALAPLSEAHVRALLDDMMQANRDESLAGLGTLIHAKTGGNPFFVTQFLKSVHQDGYLAFDREALRWSVDLDAVQQLDITENVVDLMTGQLRRLSAPTQRMLRLAACVGNRFDLATLEVIGERPAAVCAADLWPAVERGLLLAEDPSYGFAPDPEVIGPGLERRYRFLHDRVQQAAYALIAEEDRPATHLAVGRLLLARGEEPGRPEWLFDVVQQLNFGAGLMTDGAERRQLAELNLAAGRRAKASAAFPSAFGYFSAGVSLLAPDAWQESHDLAFALHLEKAEAEYLTGRLDDAEESCAFLLAQATTPLESGQAYLLLMNQYETTARYHDAVAAGLDALRILGFDLPAGREDQRVALAEQVELIQATLDGRPVAALLELPRLTDPVVRTTIKLLTILWSPAYISGDNALSDLVGARIVTLSLAHGNCEESAYGYVAFAMTVGWRLGEYALGQEFGQLGIALNDRLSDLRLRARVHHRFAALVNPWRRPFATCYPHAREAVRAGLESGDLMIAAYGQFQQSWWGMRTDPDLSAFLEQHQPTVEFLGRMRADAYREVQRMILNWAHALRGTTTAPTSLTGPDFDEERYLATYGKKGIFGSWYVTLKLELLYTFGEIETARAAARDWESTAEVFTSAIWPAMFAFWHALSICAWYPGASPVERADADGKLDELIARLRVWAENAPENFEYLHRLAAAEAARVRDDAATAFALYEAALVSTRGQESPRHRALVNECYGRFWLQRDRPRVAAAFLAEARYGYALWGATAKVAQLEHRYRDLLVTPAASSSPLHVTRETTQAFGSTFDLGAVMKAAQAVAGEIDLEQLLGRLMTVALEHAGAERGRLVLEHDGAPAVHVIGSPAGVSVRLEGATPLSDDRDLPVSLLNYVRRTGETLVLDDAAVEGPAVTDPYVVRERPRSVIATPVSNQGRLIGILYLENNLAPGAFTAERCQVLQVLAAQAATAIENARLFAEIRRLKDRVEAENVYLTEEIRTRHGFEEIVGVSPALKKVLGQVEQVAQTDTTVLITGETGTGKELVARALHSTGPRSARSLVTVNCGAISAGLVESELFGHEKGAFTGAISRKIGRFELADGGTIFLDEIGDLPGDLQVKLLRVLQEGEIERVGGTKPIKVDVRVIAATHTDLQQMVRDGRFRADLYYRLNVFPIHMPALRDRREDIPLLVRHFVLKHAQKMAKRIESIPASVMEPLCAYPWPGNIRELGNVLERSVIVSRGTVLELGDWIPMASSRASGENRQEDGEARTLQDLERAHILSTLERTSWKVSGAAGAAAALGLKPTTLESRMKKLGIRRP